MLFLRTTILGLWVLTLGTACGKSGDSQTPRDPGPDAKPADPAPIPNARSLPPPTSLNCPTGTYLTYENFGEAFMLDYCTSCHSQYLSGADRHGAPVGADFDSPVGVSIWRAAITLKVTGEAPTMPPTGNVSPADRLALTEWLNCGVPSNDGKSSLP